MGTQVQKTEVTKEQVKALITATQALANTIRELKQIPSGELFARLMTYCSLEKYNNLIDVLKKAGVIKEENHLLIWIGK